MAQKTFTGLFDEITPLLRAWESTGEITHWEGDTLYTYDVRISPLRNARNHFTGRVVVIRDSTERKRNEETIRRYALELEERNRDLDSFSDTVAHDLRAPLHLVIGYAGLLLDLDANSLPPHLVNYIKEMQHAGFKMNEMVQGLLVLARLRDVRGEAMSIPAGPVVRSALSRFRDRIQMRGIQVEVDPNLPPALAHGTWLEEIFANLIGNAISYIGQENAAPCIEIRGFQSDLTVRYEVHDNGLGLSPEMQQSLFDAFTRFHPEEGAGLGMGLSIVQRIVTRMHGTVGVDSEPGKGSTFWFILPAPPDIQAHHPEVSSPSIVGGS
jgi:signal transduction histidine kinase